MRGRNGCGAAGFNNLFGFVKEPQRRAGDLWIVNRHHLVDELLHVLERVIARDAEHPGALHYHIHLLEASADPDRAEKMKFRELSGLRDGWRHKLHRFGCNGAAHDVIKPDGMTVGRKREPPTQGFEGNHQYIRQEDKRQRPSDPPEQTSDRARPWCRHPGAAAGSADPGLGIALPLDLCRSGDGRGRYGMAVVALGDVGADGGGDDVALRHADDPHLLRDRGYRGRQG